MDVNQTGSGGAYHACRWIDAALRLKLSKDGHIFTSCDQYVPALDRT